MALETKVCCPSHRDLGPVISQAKFMLALKDVRF